MKKETIKRLKDVGANMPSLAKVHKKKSDDLLKGTDEWPPEEPAGNPLPAAVIAERTRADNETYKARRAALLKDANISEKRDFVDYIKAITDDGLDLILFAWGVLKCESVDYAGVEIDIKAKIWAAEYLTDRAFGKATQNLKIDTTLHNASDDELLKEVRLLQEKLGNKVLNANFKTEAIAGSNDTNGSAGHNENEPHGTSSVSRGIEGNGMAGEDSPDKRI